MPSVYLRKGFQALPGMADLLEASQGSPLEAKKATAKETLGLADRFGCLELPVETLKTLHVFRSLKKTTEKQSRWIMHAGCETWKALYNDQRGGPDTGLFMGLGTVHCDDDPPMYVFAGEAPQTVADTMLKNTKPLSGITLLNTTVCSHLATELGITGPTAAFSPHADAGSAALIEGYYALSEGRCSRALCGAGSQKMSPWFFLEYETLFERYPKGTWFPSEAAAFIGMDTHKENTQGLLLSVMRSGPCGPESPIPGIERFFSGIWDRNHPSPDQVIIAGAPVWRQDIHECTSQYLDTAPQFFIDSVLGYTGPAATLLAVNLAMELIENGTVLSQTPANLSCGSGNTKVTSVLVLVFGLSGQVHYLHIGRPHDA